MATEYSSTERTVIERRDPLLGAVFDQRFRVEAKIAAGGFGAIYRATHLDSHREFALKMLHRKLTDDPRVIARFRREGAALLKLQHPYTIKAYDLGEAPDGTLYIVMELLRGQSLFERFRKYGNLPWPRMLAIARAVCGSLTEAHALGIIHRDLKPTNIHLELRDADDHVKVLDFGIAKILHGSDIDSAELTTAGQMIGTLDYMSPEQMTGSECTATSDIYTLGVVMYEMIAGRRPYDDTNSAAVALAARLTTTPQRLSSRALVTPEVDRIVMRCLESQQTDRFQSAKELAAALDDALDGDGDDDVITRMARGARGADAPGFSSTLPGAGPMSSALNADTVNLRPPAAAPAAPAPIAQGPTLIGPPPVMRAAPEPRLLPPATSAVPLSTTPSGGLAAMGAKSLREAYPMINRPMPSPMRPPTPSPFDDRPATLPREPGIPRTARRAAVRRRRRLVAIGIVVAIAAAIAIAVAL